MITWGVSANSHDAAIAVFKNNNLLFASHSERFSGKKNDPDLSLSMIYYIKEKFKKPQQIVWYEKPVVKTIRQWYAGQKTSLQTNNIKQYLGQYNIFNVPIIYKWHHQSHAAGGYYTSKFSQAAIVVIDAIGEFETLTIWKGQNNNLEKIYSQWYPNSLGLWYSAMTQRCGLKPNEEEYILMGMAAYGNPDRLYNRIQEDFFKDSRKLIHLRQNLHKGCLSWAPELGPKDVFDIAAATQAVYEYYFDKILKWAKSHTNSENLVFMGGCALNCMANHIVYKHFKNVWIMPNPGDAGSSIGAVLAETQHRLDFKHAYLGYNIQPKTKIEQIVEYLKKHQICGVARGHAEFGPRSLGNRSILADPRGLQIKDRVNEIKQRQKFRPFAPVILEEHASKYFDLKGPVHSHRYMQFVSKCKYPDLYPAITHKDNSSRVQTVPKNNTSIRQILEQWYQLTGCPMLLNTSLNIKGKPMVNDIVDARIFENHYTIPVFT